MTRLEFLKNLGLSGATIFTILASCTLESCTSEANHIKPVPASSADTTRTANTGNTNPTSTGGTGNTTPKSSTNPTSGTTTGNKIDFTIDLSNPQNVALMSNGGSQIFGSVIVARTSSGNFVALSYACPHQGVTVKFQSAQNRFYCSAHGAAFNLTGAAIQGPTSRPLTQFNTKLTGTDLRVFA